jgi:hypothetical protein
LVKTGVKKFSATYLDTLRKQGANLFHALTQTFQGNVPQPRFA